MQFWESVRVALGMQEKGAAPTFLKVDKVTLNGGPLKIEWKAASEMAKDEVLIAKIIHDVFVDKFVMHQSMDKEHVEYVLQSLTGLRATVDTYVNRFVGSISAQDRFLGSVLLSLSSAAKTAMASVQDAQATEAKDREAYKRFEIGESDEILRASDALPEILSVFRREAYPSVALLIDLLPKGHLSRVRAEPLLAKTKNFLLQRFSELPEPSWEVEF